MTNHWRDIRHADLILINGANPAEAHPVGFQWFMKAKLDPSAAGRRRREDDPRRSALYAHICCLGHRTCGSGPAATPPTSAASSTTSSRTSCTTTSTSASTQTRPSWSRTTTRSRTGSSTATTRRSARTTPRHGRTSRRERRGPSGQRESGRRPGPTGGLCPARTSTHPRSVLNLMRKHYSRYTPEMVGASPASRATSSSRSRSSSARWGGRTR